MAKKCSEHAIGQNGKCCPDSGNGKCDCCDANGNPYGTLCYLPNCPQISGENHPFACGAGACPSAAPCESAGYSAAGSRPCR